MKFGRDRTTFNFNAGRWRRPQVCRAWRSAFRWALGGGRGFTFSATLSPSGAILASPPKATGLVAVVQRVGVSALLEDPRATQRELSITGDTETIARSVKDHACGFSFSISRGYGLRAEAAEVVSLSAEAKSLQHRSAVRFHVLAPRRKSYQYLHRKTSVSPQRHHDSRWCEIRGSGAKLRRCGSSGHGARSARGELDIPGVEVRGVQRKDFSSSNPRK